MNYGLSLKKISQIIQIVTNTKITTDLVFYMFKVHLELWPELAGTLAILS